MFSNAGCHISGTCRASPPLASAVLKIVQETTRRLQDPPISELQMFEEVMLRLLVKLSYLPACPVFEVCSIRRLGHVVQDPGSSVTELMEQCVAKLFRVVYNLAAQLNPGQIPAA